MKNIHEEMYRHLFGTDAESGAWSLSNLLKSPSPPNPMLRATSLADLQVLPPTRRALGGIGFKASAGQDLSFSEPNLLGGWLPMSPGLYAILIMDRGCKPRPFRVLYFGQAQLLSDRVTLSHEKLPEWRAAGGTASLYMAWHVMPNTEEWERVSVEAGLVRQYNPVCNKTFNDFSRALGF